jgi:nucleoside 2-deoxyribosyltransferase
MRIYFAGPLFSAAERDWNVALASALRAVGHEVFLPQEQNLGMDAPGIIFANDVAGIDWADGLVAIMDGADPDSGTCWEVGYAYRKKPIVLVRTDMRGTGSGSSGYNAMLTEAATIRIDAIAAPIDRVAREVLDALARIEAP